MHIVHIYRGML